MAKQTKGQGNVFRRGRIWYIRYFTGRRQIKESAHTEDRKAAFDLLKERLAAASGVNLVAHQVTVNSLLNLLVQDYREQDRSSLLNVEQRLNKNVRPAFRQTESDEADNFACSRVQRETLGFRSGTRYSESGIGLVAPCIQSRHTRRSAFGA